MSLPELDNLVRIGQLKAEPRNEAEVRRTDVVLQNRTDHELATQQLANTETAG